MRDKRVILNPAQILRIGRLSIAGLFLVALAPQAGADILTAYQAYGQAAPWDIEVNPAGGLPASNAQFDGFVVERNSGAACVSTESVTTELAGCDVADSLNLVTALQQPMDVEIPTEQPASSTASFPLSFSLWLLAGVVAALVLFRSQRRHLRKSRRR